MNKKVILGISAAAVAAVIAGAGAALMTSAPPEKIDLSSTYTTPAPSEEETAPPETTTPPENTVPETTSQAEEDVSKISASIETYTLGKISIEYPQVEGLNDEALQATINDTLRYNALSASVGYKADESKDTFSIKCQVISIDRRSLTALYTGLFTPEGAAYSTNVFYSNTMDLRDGSNLGLNNFTDSYTMAGYVLSSDVTFSGLTDEQTAAALAYRETLTIEEFTDIFNQADFPLQTGVEWPPSFSYEKQGSIFFTFPVPHALGDYVTVRFDPSTK